MAVIDLNLGGSGTTVIDENDANDFDVLNITALGSHTLIVDNVDVSIQSIAGVEALSAPTFQAQNGGSLTIDQGLLNIATLNSLTFNVVDDGAMLLDGSALDLASGITNLLNNYEVNFSGPSVGRFVYDPPGLSILGSMTFDVAGMEAGDELDLGGGTWNFENYDSINEVLTISSGTGFPALLQQDIHANIEMSASDYAIYAANPGDYLSGGDFTYPGSIVCFSAGTRILTKDGYCPVEGLKKGMLLRIYDGTLAPILWVGCSKLNAEALDLLPNMWPIRIQKDALGPGFPHRDLSVSPQHRIFVNGHSIAGMGGEASALVAAKHLTDLAGIDVVKNPKEVIYYHILLDTHEVIWAENLPAESMYIGPYTARSLNPRLRSEITGLFPGFAERFKVRADTKYHFLKRKDAKEIVRITGPKRMAFFAPGKVRRQQKQSFKLSMV